MRKYIKRMNDQKKIIGRKRKKIFSIEKINNKRPPKIQPNPKTNFSSFQQLFSTIPKISSLAFKNNSNLGESQNKLREENHRHSLINISKQVFQYLNKIENTTGNDVTEHIKNELQSKKNDESNQKNIQRRVYDAINVMCAAGLITKNKQEIHFLKKSKKESANNENKTLNGNIYLLIIKKELIMMRK